MKNIETNHHFGTFPVVNLRQETHLLPTLRHFGSTIIATAQNIPILDEKHRNQPSLWHFPGCQWGPFYTRRPTSFPLYAISDLQSLPLLRIFPFRMKNIESNHHFPSGCRQSWGPFFVIPLWHYSQESIPQPRRCCHHTPQLASAEYIESKW
jgi:hypothetical protein